MIGALSFKKLHRQLDTSLHANNGSSPNGTASLTELPATILETFIPGYSLISGFIFDAFGFDVSILVSSVLILFAIFHVGTYVENKFTTFFSRYCMSSIYVDDGDDLHDSILDWIGEHQMARLSRSVKAVTRYAHAQVSNESSEADEVEALDDNGIFNFSKYAARLPPRYEPYFGSHRFWHKGRIFFFDRSRREMQSNPWSGRPSDEQTIRLTCIGRSTDPVRALLGDIKSRALDKQKSLTNIRRPAPKDLSRRSGAWDRVSQRPSRPMDTVSLDAEQKNRVIADINEYLHPSSPAWYSARGIPWRRGYLFHGPPGTGKSSLSFAVAGLFGLDIYVISLLEPTLTEGDLNRLFSNLPRRCVVLLEDIDTAGLLRDEKSDKDDETEKVDPKDDDKITAKDLAKAIKSAYRKEKTGDDANKGISLSGLLNAIDGVASHEGRVLVMTTNHPEKLDAALIRPGRVDLQVSFSLATHEQIREIFVRMYSVIDDSSLLGSLANGIPTKPLTNGYSHHEQKPNGVTAVLTNGVSKGEANGYVNGTPNGHSKPKSVEFVTPYSNNGLEHGSISPDELMSLAAEFAKRIPEATFSPAEVQGFLLIRKKDPHRAILEVEAWKVSMLEAKEKKTKVVGVQ